MWSVASVLVVVRQEGVYCVEAVLCNFREIAWVDKALNFSSTTKPILRLLTLCVLSVQELSLLTVFLIEPNVRGFKPR